jgi:hypothetical protein
LKAKWGRLLHFLFAPFNLFIIDQRECKRVGQAQPSYRSSARSSLLESGREKAPSPAEEAEAGSLHKLWEVLLEI